VGPDGAELQLRPPKGGSKPTRKEQSRMDWNAIIAFAAIIADLAAFDAVCVAYRAFKSQELAFRTSSDALTLSLSANLISGLEEKFGNETLKGVAQRGGAATKPKTSWVSNLPV